MKSRKARYILAPKPLGVGGQAEVFEARDRLTNGTVALKRITSRDQEAIERMRREIEVQRAVQHPNVMPVLDASKNFQWYTMPLAAQTLGRLVPPIDDKIIFQVVEDCAKGLAAAHAQGYIHRDITPNNILLLKIGSETKWVVSDWGLVRRHGLTTIARTLPGHPFGTMGFAAPELWEDAHAATNQADVYSLGRVVAWCVTGKWPVPNIELIPEGPWLEFVYLTTQQNQYNRVQNMEQIVELLNRMRLGQPLVDTDSFNNEFHLVQEEDTAYYIADDAQDDSETERFEPLNPVQAKYIIRDRAREAINTLKNRDIVGLAALSHPQKGIRFSPYPWVSNHDLAFMPDKITSLFDDKTEYLWGYADGSGFPMRSTFENYYNSFVYNQDFMNADSIRYNEPMESGNTASNALDFYRNSITVEYYFIGFNPEYSGMDWESLQLAFQKFEDQWFVVGIIHGHWTI